MAGYNATIQGEATKQHRCVGCGAVFRYLMKRKGGGHAPTAVQAQANARQALGLQLTTEVDAHPCPGCGIYQPEMVARARRGVHGVVSFFLHVAPLVLVGLAFIEWLNWHVTAWAATGAAALALLLHVRSATVRPNADLEKNRRVAEQELAAGKLQGQAGSSAIEPALRPGQGELDPGRKRALALFALAVLALPAAELFRLARGWPLNPAWTPGVIGPGDSAVLHFASEVRSVSAIWTGSGGAQSLPPAAPALFRVSSREEKWGSTIRAKSSDGDASSRVWARVHFDGHPELAGQTMPIRVELNVRYPGKNGSSFANQTRTLAEFSEVRFAPPGAGDLYFKLLLAGFGGGSVLIAALGLALVKRKHELGAPSESELVSQ